MAELYRKEVLERLSSPERLDELMQVVSPKNWLALGAFGALIAAALLWGVIGRLPIMVMGPGILIYPRKVVDFQSPSTGRISTLTIQSGDVVQQGDVLGTIDQSETRQRLQVSRTKLNAFRVQGQKRTELQSEQTDLQIERNQLEQHTMQLRRRDLQKRLQDARAKSPLLKKKIESYKRLERLGLLPSNSNERLQVEQSFLENQDKVAELTFERQQLESQFKQLESQEKSIVLKNLELSTTQQNQIQELQNKIAELELQLQNNSQIISAHNGRILEVTVNVGQLVPPGQRLGSMQVEKVSSELSGVVYFPIRVGKKIQPGMPIQISPDTVARERFGSITGTVTSVSPFPVTKEGIESLVGSPEVVAHLMGDSPAIEVVAELMRDPSTSSGYKWSSSGSPDLNLTSGTTAVGRVAIEYRSPIGYLIPALREISGIY